MADNEYTGPNLTPDIPIGFIRTNPPGPATAAGTYGEGYADVSYLRTLLADIVDDCKNLIADCETKLSTYSLITDNNETLQKANSIALAQYNTSGQEDAVPSQYAISYRQYVSVHSDNTNSADQYIKQTYETNIRGTSGTNALDIKQITGFIQYETEQIQKFLNDFLGEIDDSSEFRVLELFQDWAEDAKITVLQLRTVYEGATSPRLPQTELDTLDSESAKQHQALLQVKLNSTNDLIASTLNKIQKNYIAWSTTFYWKFLGPSLSFRLGVTKNIENQQPKGGEILLKEAASTVSAMDSNFAVNLSDQMKRNQMFKGLISDAMQQLTQRDGYVNYINQLSVLGKAVPAKFTSSTIPAELGDFLTEVEQTMTIAPESFDNSHNMLANREDPSAHPQYILAAGGTTITGDIEMEDDVRIGGIVPSKHKHDGLDGSAKIDGSNIVPGSVTPDVVDPSNVPLAPTSLHVVSQTPRIVPPGMTKVSVELGFVNNYDAATNFEFEITVLS